MKTKPITLILTLLFCLSGSVFAEENSRIEYKPLKEFTEINLIKFYADGDLAKKQKFLMERLNNKDGIARLTNDLEYIESVEMWVAEVSNIAGVVLLCYKYEENFYTNKISNEKVIKFHNDTKKLFLTSLGHHAQKKINNFKWAKSNINDSGVLDVIDKYIEYCVKLNNYSKKYIDRKFVQSKQRNND